MLICLRDYVEWLETWISLNLKNYRFSICTCSITSWTGSNDSITVATCSIIENTSLVDTTDSIWMLSII